MQPIALITADGKSRDQLKREARRAYLRFVRARALAEAKATATQD